MDILLNSMQKYILEYVKLFPLNSNIPVLVMSQYDQDLFDL